MFAGDCIPGHVAWIGIRGEGIPGERGQQLGGGGIAGAGRDYGGHRLEDGGSYRSEIGHQDGGAPAWNDPV